MSVVFGEIASFRDDTQIIISPSGMYDHDRILSTQTAKQYNMLLNLFLIAFEQLEK